MNIANQTKAQLIEQNTALEQRILNGARLVRDLREQLVMAKQPALVYTQAVQTAHSGYYAYARECRAVAKAAGRRVATYMSFAQWSAQ